MLIRADWIRRTIRRMSFLRQPRHSKRGGLMISPPSPKSRNSDLYIASKMKTRMSSRSVNRPVRNKTIRRVIWRRQTGTLQRRMLQLTKNRRILRAMRSRKRPISRLHLMLRWIVNRKRQEDRKKNRQRDIQVALATYIPHDQGIPKPRIRLLPQLQVPRTVGPIRQTRRVKKNSHLPPLSRWSTRWLFKRKTFRLSQ